MAKCHRYFHRVGDAADSNGNSVLIGGYQPVAGDDYTSYVQHPVEMRATPTSTISGTWTKVNSSDIKTAYVTTKGFTFFGTISGAGAWYLHANSTDDHVSFDAEL